MKLELAAVGRRYGVAAPTDAIRNVNLTINSGEFVAIMGPSGSGKSTLLNVLGLIDRPTSGDYRIDGRSVADLGESELNTLRATGIGFVFQAFHLIEHRTVLENVELGLLYARRGRRADRRRLSIEALDTVGLGSRCESLPSELSGGQRQRVAIARGIVGGRAVLLCDEPTGNLDSVTAQRVLEILTELAKSGRTIVLVTHDNVVAASAERCVHVLDGLVSARAVSAVSDAR